MAINFCETSELVGEDSTDAHEVLTWEDLKEEIEGKAIDDDIEVSWILEDGKIKPDSDNDYFCDLCYEVFREEFSYWDEGTTKSTRDLNPLDLEISKGAVNKIIENAAQMGYNDIIELMKHNFY